MLLTCGGNLLLIAFIAQIKLFSLFFMFIFMSEKVNFQHCDEILSLVYYNFFVLFLTLLILNICFLLRY